MAMPTRIVLFCTKGDTISGVAHHPGVSHAMVGTWGRPDPLRTWPRPRAGAGGLLVRVSEVMPRIHRIAGSW